MKICNHCKIEKELNQFYKRQSKCKFCCAEKQRADKDKINKKTAKWRHANKEKHNAAVRNWREANPEKQKESSKNWRSKNPTYTIDRRKVDPAFRIMGNIRRRVNHAINGKFKNGSAIKDMGCTPEELVKYLEYQFQDGMTWENYGEWEVDHVKPLSLFNLEDREQFLEANHYTNLQPLWWRDNARKGNKLIY